MTERQRNEEKTEFRERGRGDNKRQPYRWWWLRCWPKEYRLNKIWVCVFDM
ncbi:conserved hypothetical protein [Ricinus communis]|uniref:Uncharacterized protein n=1 Tax=Ricinus communis TaxID=3988 RepID=B9RJ09_RICCO|nr:conserved hypothetical protein [Ricinus communis]